MKRILAAVVLYRMEAAASPAFSSFCRALEQNERLRAIFRLAVYDNSPQPQTLPNGCADTYVHDASNPGLAKPYSQALALAAEAGIPWLLVLDQDTVVTEAYLEEAATLTETHSQNQHIAAFVPRLVQDGQVQSPHTLLGLRPSRPVPSQTIGVATTELHAFNSGAIFRVASLQAAGGFPLHFPMEYLDYATFRLLQRGGDRLYVMAAKLDHELAMRAMLQAPETQVPERMRQVFEHELRFYRELGTPSERFLHRIRLVIRAFKAVRSGAYQRAWLLIRLALGAAKVPPHPVDKISIL